MSFRLSPVRRGETISALAILSRRLFLLLSSRSQMQREGVLSAIDVDDDASAYLSGEEVRGGHDGIAERDFAGDRIELRRIEVAREA